MPRSEPQKSSEAIAAVFLLLALGLAAAAAVGGFFIGRDTKHTTTATVAASTTTSAQPAATVDPHVAAGAHDFVQFACAQCHGELGRGGVSPDVPALTNAGKTLTAAELHSIVNHGLGASSNPTKPFMPVWGAVISPTQVDDLVSYIHAGLPAVPTAVPPAVPTGQGAAVAGGTLYAVYGCINCHGPNGLGGVPNPQSPDKTIPPLSGQDFRSQFNTDAKIIAVIRSGSVIGSSPIVSMPHWGGIIPNDRLDALVAYLKTLK